MYAPRRILFAAGAITGLLILGVGPQPAEAVSLAAVCRKQCRDDIKACVSTGQRRATCRKGILRRCKSEGVQVCEPSEEGDLRVLVAGASCTVQADTFVQQTDQNKNYGTKSLLQVDNSPMQRTFIRIVVSGVGSGQQVTSAGLRLRADHDDESDSGGRIHSQLSCAWNETALTWSNQPGFSNAVLDSKGSVSKDQLVEFNVTSTVPGDGGVSGNGTFCYVIDSLSTNGIDYNSREASSALRPTCVVQVSGATTTTTTATSTTSTSTTTSSTNTSTTTTVPVTTTTTSTTTTVPVTTTTTSTTTSTTTTTTTTSTTTTTLRFVDNGDGTVTDRQTCLVWEKKTDDNSIHDKDNAYAWCIDGDSDNLCDNGPSAPDGPAFTTFLTTLNGGVTGVGNCVSSNGSTQTGGFAGHCDWRLPTIVELQTIMDTNQGVCAGGSGGCIDPIFGPTDGLSSTWSSTSYPSIPSEDDAWYVVFDGGGVGDNIKGIAYQVRAVRGRL